MYAINLAVNEVKFSYKVFRHDYIYVGLESEKAYYGI